MHFIRPASSLVFSFVSVSPVVLFSSGIAGEGKKLCAAKKKVHGSPRCIFNESESRWEHIRCGRWRWAELNLGGTRAISSASRFIQGNSMQISRCLCVHTSLQKRVASWCFLKMVSCPSYGFFKRTYYHLQFRLSSKRLMRCAKTLSSYGNVSLMRNKSREVLASRIKYLQYIVHIYI